MAVSLTVLLSAGVVASSAHEADLSPSNCEARLQAELSPIRGAIKALQADAARLQADARLDRVASLEAEVSALRQQVDAILRPQTQGSQGNGAASASSFHDAGVSGMSPRALGASLGPRGRLWT